MRRLKIFAFCTLVPGLLLGLWIMGANGRAFRVDALPDKGANRSCGTCHVNPAGGGARNSFGNDWEQLAVNAGDVYTDELAQKDSDSDGFTNDEEFNADPPTEPWNKNSKPPEPQAVKKLGKKLTMWAKLKRR